MGWAGARARGGECPTRHVFHPLPQASLQASIEQLRLDFQTETHQLRENLQLLSTQLEVGPNFFLVGTLCEEQEEALILGRWGEEVRRLA